MTFSTIPLVLLVLLTSGCSSVIDRFYNRDVVEDSMSYQGNGNQEIGTLAVTAQRRLIIGNLKTGDFCSEPPPEVADSITSAIAASLNTNLIKDKDVSADLASNFARHINQLYKRSHTVQLFRDASYHLCVNAVNAADSPQKGYASYKKDVLELVRLLKPALVTEITAYYDVEKERAKNPPALYQEAIVCDSTAAVGKGQQPNDANKLSTAINCRPLFNKEPQQEGSDEKSSKTKG